MRVMSSWVQRRRRALVHRVAFGMLSDLIASTTTALVAQKVHAAPS
jgi:hypothetical protein